MTQENKSDYYDVLQVGTNAEPETINRVYRMLAQRFHPDNQATGNEPRFRELLEAYTVLSDPEKRARYDATHQRQQQERWRLVSAGARAENDFEMEQAARLTVLEVLYTKRRLETDDAGVYMNELEKLTGRPREHLGFTVWYLVQKKLVTRGDDSRLLLTAEGADHLEQNYGDKLRQKRLRAANVDE